MNSSAHCCRSLICCHSPTVCRSFSKLKSASRAIYDKYLLYIYLYPTFIRPKATYITLFLPILWRYEARQKLKFSAKHCISHVALILSSLSCAKAVLKTLCHTCCTWIDLLVDDINENCTSYRGFPFLIVQNFPPYWKLKCSSQPVFVFCSGNDQNGPVTVQSLTEGDLPQLGGGGVLSQTRAGDPW